MSSMRDLIIRISGKSDLKGMTRGASKELGATASAAGRAGKTAGDQFSKNISSGILGTAKKLAGPIAGLFAIDKIKDFAKGAYEEARESQKVGAQTNAVIKSTGGVANVSAKAVGRLATAISNKTGIDDETIQSGANMLLTFKNIRDEAGKGNKIFDQATSVLTDMSTAMGVEPKKAAIQLGKALNDPVKGISALSRVGVTFTKQQQKTIGALVKGGKTAEAQKIILKELGSEFGGSAEAQATAGEKLTTTWNNFKESIGTKAMPVVDKLFDVLRTKGIPALEGMIKSGRKVVGWAKDLWQSVQPSLAELGDNLGKIFGPSLSSAQGALSKLKPSFGQIKDVVVKVVGGLARFSGWIAKNKGLIEAGATTIGLMAGGLKLIQLQQKAVAAGGFIKWITGVVKSTKIWAAAQTVLNVVMDANPIGLVVIAVAALVAGFIVAYKKSATFRKIVQGALNGVKDAAHAVAKWFTGTFVPFFTKTLPGAFRSGLGQAKKIWHGIISAVEAPFKAAGRGVTSAWSGITGTFTKSKNWVSGTWRKGWSGVKGWIGDAVGKGKNDVSAALGKTGSGVQASFNKLRQWGGTTFKRAWAGAKMWLSDPVQAGKNSIANTKRGVQTIFNGLDSFGRTVFGKRWAGMKAKLTQPIQNARDYLKKIFGPGGGGLRQIFSDAVSAIGRIFGKIRGALLAPIRSAIGVINTGLIKGGINWILNKIGVPKSKQIPWIPVPRFAEGGRSIGRGGQRTRKDGILALVDHGEHHMKTRSTRALDRSLPGGLDYMNRTGKWPVGPAAEVNGANEQASRGNSLPIRNIAGLPSNVVDLVRRGPRLGEPAGYGANPLGFAASEVGHGGWYNRCLAFVNAAWNYTVGRFRLATARQSAMAGPRTMSGTAPAGAAGYWDTGPAGHVALSAGDGTYYSNDVITPGVISRVRKAVIDRWGPFMGWWSPTGAKGVPGAPGGLLSGVWNFLKGLSPLKWLANKAAGVAGAIPGAGTFGAALKRIPPFIVSRAGSRLMDMFTNGGGQWFDNGRGVLPTGTSIVHNGTGRPEPLVDPTRYGGGPQVVINVNGALDPVAVARQIEQILRQHGRTVGPVQLTRRAA